MVDDEFFNHGLVVVDEKERIVHFVGYPEKPTETDIKLLLQELAEDAEFGLVDILDSCSIHEAQPHVLEHFKNAIKED